MIKSGDDARMLIRRAQKHYDEFKQYRDGQIMGPMWEVRHRSVECGVTYSLHLNRALFVELKPVVADIANNVIHSLDLLIGELARAGGTIKPGKPIYFPWVEGKADFEGKLKHLSKFIDEEKLAAIAGVRQKWEASIKHVHALKTVSNLSKHWELVPSTAGAAAVQWRPLGDKPIIWELPYDAFAQVDEFELRTVAEPFQCGCEIWMSFKFSGLGEGFDPTPETVIDFAMKYAVQTIAAVFP